MRNARPYRGRAAHVGSVLVPAAFALAVLSGCRQSVLRPEVAFERTAWTYGSSPGHKIVTEHYEIYTTLQDDVLIDAWPDFVERAYEHYAALVPPARAPRERMRVYVFARRGEWEHFTRRFTGPRASTFLKVLYGGYSDRGVSVIQYVSHGVTFPLFAHEGLHQYLHHHVNPGVPAWLNEGLAVYAEGQRWGPDRVEAFDPWFNPQRQNALTEAFIAGKLHPVSKLLRTHAGEVIEGSTESVNHYYAQVWALVLFLREGAGGKYRDRFEHLLSMLADTDLRQYAQAAFITSKRDSFNLGEELFRALISDDLATVEREYRAFIQERMF